MEGYLGINEVFTAGDFPVTVLQASGSNGVFSGVGYVEIPYLQDTKIVVKFTNIRLNSDRQLIAGTLETSYDKTEKNVVSLSEEYKRISENIKALVQQKREQTEAIFGEQGEEYEKELQEWAVEEEKRQTEVAQLKMRQENSIDADISQVQNTENQINTSEKEQTGNKEKSTTNSQNSAVATKYYIEYKNKKYYDGDVLELPFKRNMFSEHFKMGELAEFTSINWTLYERGIDRKILETETDKKNRSNTVFFDLNGGRSENTTLLSVEAQAQTEGEPKVELLISKKVKEFKHNELKAIDLDNKNRVAKNGETLYYVHKLDKKFRNTDFQIDISPKVSIDEIPKNHIEWYHNGTRLDHDKLSLNRNLSHKNKDGGINNIEISARIGNPMAGEYKKVKVEWVKEDRKAVSAMPPGVSEVLTKRIEDLGDKLRFVDRKINLGLKFKIDPIKISGESYNREKRKSPLYEEVMEWAITGGIKAEGEATITHPIFKQLERANILRLGIFGSADLTFGVKGAILQTKAINQKEYKNQESYADIFGTGCFSFGVVTQLLVAKDVIDCEVKGYAKACLQGKIEYNFTRNENAGKLLIPPVVLGLNAKVKSKGWVEFELVDFEGEIALTEEITLYEKKLSR